MDLMAYVRILRRRWPIVVAATALAAALAGVLTMITPRTYQSTVQFFVSTATGDAGNSAQLASGNTFTAQRVKSYAQLLKTPKALDPVVAETGVGTTDQLVSKVTATIPPDSVLLNVAVTDGHPEVAQRLAAGIAKTLPATISELEDVNGTSPVKVTVVKDAELNAAPVAPRPVRNIALGVILGLLIGFGLAVLRELMDTKVRTKDDVEALSDATLLGGIPFDSDADKHPLILHSDPTAGRAEAFRTLRTNLRFVDATQHPQSIVVTSSIAGEGKSTTTANLALALAESGASVVVIEADLRRPRLLQYFGLQSGIGLTDVLIGRHSFADVIQPFGRLNLHLLGDGPTPPNPSELLGSRAMGDLLEQLSNRYDYVLIDAPPVLPVTDAAVLATQADGVIMVIGSGVVTKDMAADALESLETVNGNILGLVLNRVPRDRSGGYYDYRYEYKPDVGRAAGARGHRSLRRRGAAEPEVDPVSPAGTSRRDGEPAGESAKSRLHEV